MKQNLSLPSFLAVYNAPKRSRADRGQGLGPRQNRTRWLTSNTPTAMANGIIKVVRKPTRRLCVVGVRRHSKHHSIHSPQFLHQTKWNPTHMSAVWPFFANFRIANFVAITVCVFVCAYQLRDNTHLPTSRRHFVGSNREKLFSVRGKGVGLLDWKTKEEK